MDNLTSKSVSSFADYDNSISAMVTDDGRLIIHKTYDDMYDYPDVIGVGDARKFIRFLEDIVKYADEVFNEGNKSESV